MPKLIFIFKSLCGVALVMSCKSQPPELPERSSAAFLVEHPYVTYEAEAIVYCPQICDALGAHWNGFWVEKSPIRGQGASCECLDGADPAPDMVANPHALENPDVESTYGAPQEIQQAITYTDGSKGKGGGSAGGSGSTSAGGGNATAGSSSASASSAGATATAGTNPTASATGATSQTSTATPTGPAVGGGIAGGRAEGGIARAIGRAQGSAEARAAAQNGKPGAGQVTSSQAPSVTSSQKAKNQANSQGFDFDEDESLDEMLGGGGGVAVINVKKDKASEVQVKRSKIRDSNKSAREAAEECTNNRADCRDLNDR